MRVRIGIAGATALAAVAGVVTSPAGAALTVVADFQDDFGRTNSPPSVGWSYRWNENGPLGNPANYNSLTVIGEQYLAPNQPILVGKNANVDPVAYPVQFPFPATFPQTFVRPGAGSGEDAGGIERAVVLAYTFSAEDIAAAGATGQAAAFITAYDFAVSTQSSPEGMSARIYHHNDPTPLLEFSDDVFPPFAPGFRFETTLDPRPIPLGVYAPGETVYIALGGNSVAGGDEMRLDFTLSMDVVPEPGIVALVAPAALLLMRRRRA
jgi:hypothetical protein